MSHPAALGLAERAGTRQSGRRKEGFRYLRNRDYLCLSSGGSDVQSNGRDVGSLRLLRKQAGPGRRGAQTHQSAIPGARLLFLKADELIRSVRISKTDNPSRDDVAAVGPSVLRSLKGLLVQKVSLHDASLGQRLSREYGLETLSPSDIASLDNNEVSALIRQGQLASATKALHGMMDDSLSGRRSLLSFLSLLFALRAQDGQAADKLFIDATLRMREQPNVTADNVLIIGNYLFAGRHLDAKLLTAPQVFISPITLAGC